MREIFRTTVLGGILFMLPLVVVVAAVGKALSIIHVLATPLLEFLPANNVAGIAMIHILSFILLIAVCFLAGLAAQRPAAGRLVSYLERDVLLKFPPYALFKAKTGSVLNPEERGKLTPVVVRFDDSWQLAYQIERLEGDKEVVFLPGSPEPWAGTVCAVESDRVASLDTTVKSVGDALKRLGKGSADVMGQGAN